MFDPTVFDNIKVVLEGAVYDLDLNGSILVTGRKDQIDMSSMSRDYAIEFAQKPVSPTRAQIRLCAHLSDLAAEILENPSAVPGCTLEISLNAKVKRPDTECPKIKQELNRIWGNRPQIVQQLSYVFDGESDDYDNRITLTFGRKIDEGHIEDIPNLVDCALRSVVWLDQRGA